MYFYRVVIAMPVLNSEYFVVADNMNQAAEKAIERDQSGGGTSAGVDSVHYICETIDTGALIL